MSDVHVVAATKSWNRTLFEERLRNLSGEWHLIDDPEDLTVEALQRLAPRYVFFLHWSWRVPQEVLSAFECVCFHMTDVPYGRGGSPLQNLIARGDRQTQLTALRMVEELDAGPVYLKRPLSLEGGAEEIYLRGANLAAGMIEEILSSTPEPTPQVGNVETFRRRRPAESRIAEVESLADLHDFIRMLDAEGYPRAYLEHGPLRFEFSRSALYEGRLVADVRVTMAPRT